MCVSVCVCVCVRACVGGGGFNEDYDVFQQNESRSKRTSLHVGLPGRWMRHVAGQLLQPVLRPANRIFEDTPIRQAVRNTVPCNPLEGHPLERDMRSNHRLTFT